VIFHHIEKLKNQFTDKYVVVDDSQPELKRFSGLTGAVKTVNMSGRALVEFDGYNNIGWYDIDPVFLRVVPAPAPKPAESKKDKAAAPKAETPKAPAAGAKPVGEKKAPAAAAPKAPAAGKSVAEILAAARKPASAAAAPTAEAKPAAAAPAKLAPRGKGMSMEDILAAARGKKTGRRSARSKGRSSVSGQACSCSGEGRHPGRCTEDRSRWQRNEHGADFGNGPRPKAGGASAGSYRRSSARRASRRNARSRTAGHR